MRKPLEAKVPSFTDCKRVTEVQRSSNSRAGEWKEADVAPPAGPPGVQTLACSGLLPRLHFFWVSLRCRYLCDYTIHAIKKIDLNILLG